MSTPVVVIHGKFSYVCIVITFESNEDGGSKSLEKDKINVTYRRGPIAIYVSPKSRSHAEFGTPFGNTLVPPKLPRCCCYPNQTLNRISLVYKQTPTSMCGHTEYIICRRGDQGTSSKFCHSKRQHRCGATEYIMRRRGDPGTTYM